MLVADDTESIRALFRKLLAADGHDVVIAVRTAPRRSTPCRSTIRTSSSSTSRMPQVDGLEVCRRLKSDPATRLTPVVLVTGLTDLSDRIRGIEAGADEFLSKPVHPHELRARVRSLSRMKHLIDALDSAEAAFMTLALTIEARDPNDQRALRAAGAARRAARAGARPVGRRPRTRCIAAATCTTSARSAFPTRCC